MQTVAVKVYLFDELSKSAKDKARQWWREGIGQDGWWRDTFEDAKQCLAMAGFTIDQIFFSGFSSQGDGACFEGSWDATECKQPVAKTRAHAPKDKTLLGIARDCGRIARRFPTSGMRVKYSGHYSHERCTVFTTWLNENESGAYTNNRQDGIEAIVDVSRDAMRWIYRQLEAEYDYINSDKEVDEAIRANEYTFTADGERFVI